MPARSALVVNPVVVRADLANLNAAAANQPAVPRRPKHHGFAIKLLGIWIHDNHEGATRGKTGEFYWYSLCADAVQVITASQDIQSGVRGWTWLDDANVGVFRGNTKTAGPYVNVDFNLLESDDGDEAAAALSTLGSIAGLATAIATGNPQFTDLGALVGQLAGSMIGFDDDDTVIRRKLGLWATGERYRMGRFFTLAEAGKHGCRAVFGVVPSDVPAAVNDTAVVVGQWTKKVKMTKAFCLGIALRRSRVPWLRTTCFIEQADGTVLRKIDVQNVRTRNYWMPKGEYIVRVESPIPCDVDLMATPAPYATEVGVTPI